MTRARDLAAFVSNADGDVKFDTDTLFIDSSANRVGIGVTDPSTQMEIKNSTAGSQSAQFRANNDNDIGINVGVWGSSGSTYGAFQSNTAFISGSSVTDLLMNTNTASSNIRFATGASGGTERMRITDDGLLTANNHQIDILDGSGDVSMRLNNLSSAQNSGRISIDPDNSAASSTLAVYIDGTEEVRVDSDGLKFNGDTAAANALDDYEEGTYTHTITGSTSGSWTVRSGYTTLGYTKIGRLVTVTGQLETLGTKTASGNCQVSLPFAAASGQAFSTGSAFPLRNNGTSLEGTVYTNLSNTQSFFLLTNLNHAGTLTILTDSHLDASWEGKLHISYFTDA